MVAVGTFVGGQAIPVWFDDPLSPPARPTNDTDIVLRIATRLELARIDDALRDHGWEEDVMSGVICRWRHREAALVVDVMPHDATVLGFSNPWHESAIAHAAEFVASDGRLIRVADPTHLVATKLVAWKQRGNGDLVASHDVEDIALLVTNCTDIVQRVGDAPNDVREFVGVEVASLLSERDADWILPSHLGGSPADEQRGRELLMPRLERIAAEARSRRS